MFGICVSGLRPLMSYSAFFKMYLNDEINESKNTVGMIIHPAVLVKDQKLPGNSMFKVMRGLCDRMCIYRRTST